MLACQASNLGSVPGKGTGFDKSFTYKSIFLTKFFMKIKISEKLYLNRQCIYLQLKKPSGIEIENTIHKRLATD